MAKVNVPSRFMGLWHQVLLAPVKLTLEETSSRYAEISALYLLDLVKYEQLDGVGGSVDLSDQSMRLSLVQIKVLTFLSGRGSKVTTAGFVTWAGGLKLERPLDVLKSLIDLDLVEIKKEDQAYLQVR